MRKRTKKKINIIKFLRSMFYLVISTTSIVYAIVIILISLYNYLYNRPYKLVAFISVFSIISFTIDYIKENKAEQNRTKQRTSARHH